MNGEAVKVLNVGKVAAYADAVAGGYTGTREEWEQAMAGVGSEATAALAAKNDAVQAKNGAVSAKNDAVTAKNEAVTAKNAAAGSASDAHTDALAATAAKEAAQTAQGLAVEAASGAAGAKTAAQTAQGKAEDAQTAAETAQGAAEDAQEAAETAQDKAEDAQAAAEEAARTLTIDTTLTQSGQAADAKKTGDEFADLKSAVNGDSGFLDSKDFILGALLTTNNVITIDTSYTTIICTPSPLIYPKSITITPNSGYRMAILWCNAEGTYAATSTGWKTEAITIPANKHFMISLRRVTDAGAITISFVENFPISPSLIGITEEIVFEKIKNPIYVSSSSGNDNTGNGSESTPYKTIDKAISTGANLIYVEPGLYKEAVSVSGRNIKIIARWKDYNSSTLSVRPKIIIDGDSTISTALTIENCPSVELEGITVQNCTGDGAYIHHCSFVNVQNCDFNSNDNNGIVINYASGIFKDCAANNNDHDGFNINYFGDTQFINCSGHDNGDDGISHHQGTTGMIDGGEWYNNVKGGIASPCYGAIVDIKNVYSHNNGYGVYAHSSNNDEKRTFHIWNCVLTNNSNYGISSRYNNAIIYGNKISGNTTGQTTAPGGSLTTLD